MREWIPVPGSVKARLVEAAVHQFELAGYEAVNVTELVAKANVTTGALYHHFDSKLGLYLVVREEMERRVVDRMAGAVAAVESTRSADRRPAAVESTGSADPGRAAVRAALLVAFDATVHFGVCRILAEPVPVARVDPIEATLQPLLPVRARAGGMVLAAAWRASLLAAANGTPSTTARESLTYVLG